MTWQSARNILCVRLDSMGDVLMTTPAIRAVRESRPDSRITLLTSSSGAAAGRLVPEIDDVIVYEAPWNKATDPPHSSASDRELIRRLREQGFDAAIIFTVFSQNPLPAALMCYLADIPLRLAHCRENPYYLLSDWVRERDGRRRKTVACRVSLVECSSGNTPHSTDHTLHAPAVGGPWSAVGLRHEVQRQLDLVAEVGYRTEDERLSLRVPHGARARVRALLAEQGLALEAPWVVIHAGATAPSRRYPPELFARVARKLVLAHGMAVVFTGTASEQELVDGIRVQMGAASHSVAGKLELGELAALLEMAPAVISNNSGPAHVAAAVQTPVVDLYALTNPQHTPWRVPQRVLYHDVPCKYCYKSICPEGHHDCLRKVAPEQVVEAVMELISVRRHV